MYQKSCALLRASICWMGGGGGGGGGSVQMRQPSQEKKTIGNWYDFQQNQYFGFRNRDPLLQQSTQGALSAYQQMFPGWMQSYKNYVEPVLASGGALTPEQVRDVTQQARGIGAQQGTVRGVGELGTELLNRQSAQQQRYQQALGQAGQIQGLQTGSLNQMLGVGNAAVSQFTGLENPILGYLSALFQGNQQASIAQAQIAAQQNAASQGKMGSTIGGGISAIGSIAGAAL